jgi:putative two-component system response regulator
VPEAAAAQRILVIDDDPIVRSTVVEMLARSGFAPVEASAFDEALRLLEDPEISLVVSDIVMPGASGFELTEAVHERRPSVPVLLITGAGTDRNLSEALSRGAAGLIPKPFTMAELTKAVSAVLDRQRESEAEVRRRFVPGVLADVLASVLEARDGSVHGHCDRLTDLAAKLGDRMGLVRDEIDTVTLGALLHDIGKIGIPDSILLKPGPLDPQEWGLMRSHTEIGDRLLARFPELGQVRKIVRHHHERWDGTGYPDGLAGEDIPLAARIVSVADAIEAMSVRRAYRDPLTPSAIVAELEAGRGRQWDPAVVDCALELILTGALVLERGGLQLVHAEPDPIWSEEELARFAEMRIGDLVRMVLSLGECLDGGSLERAEAEGESIVPRRRQEALSVLTALKAALREVPR